MRSRWNDMADLELCLSPPAVRERRVMVRQHHHEQHGVVPGIGCLADGLHQRLRPAAAMAFDVGLASRLQ